jgi:hypothetical protein
MEGEKEMNNITHTIVNPNVTVKLEIITDDPIRAGWYKTIKKTILNLQWFADELQADSDIKNNRLGMMLKKEE